MNAHSAPTRRTIAIALVAMVCSASSAYGQGILERLGQGFKNLQQKSADLLLSQATTYDLAGRGIAPVAIGGATLSLNAIDIKDTTVIRIRGYLENPGPQALVIPMFGDGAVALTDGAGRQVKPVGKPKVKGVGEGAGELTVPAGGRVQVAFVYQALKPTAGVGTLRVASYGMMTGIPLTADAAGQAMGAPGNTSPAPMPAPMSAPMSAPMPAADPNAPLPMPAPMPAAAVVAPEPAAIAPASTPAPAGKASKGSMPTGSYECWANGRGRGLMNFTVRGPGQYADSNGQPGAFRVGPDGTVTFKGGGLDGILPVGYRAAYVTPKGVPTVSFRNAEGDEVTFCERVR